MSAAGRRPPGSTCTDLLDDPDIVDERQRRAERRHRFRADLVVTAGPISHQMWMRGARPLRWRGVSVRVGSPQEKGASLGLPFRSGM